MTASDNKKIGEIVGGFAQTEPDWKKRTKGQEGSFFYYGKGMQDKFVSASKLLTDYIGEKYGARVKKSILENRLIVANRKPPKKIKKEDELKLVDYDDRILWERQHKKYYSLVEEITDDLSKVFHLLLGHCYQTLIVRMRSDKEFMALDGNESAGQLWRIITKLCDGTNVGEHPLRTALESLFNLFLIRGDDFKNSADFLESFDQRVTVAEAAGWSFCSEKLRDLAIDEYIERNDRCETCLALVVWQEVDTNEPNALNAGL